MKIEGNGNTTNEAWQDAMQKIEKYVSPETKSWIADKHWSIRPNMPNGWKVHLDLVVVVQEPSA